MKKAIFCVAIGPKNKMYTLALRVMKQYAQKIGADLIVQETPHFNIQWEVTEKFKATQKARYAWIEKLYAIELLKTYDRVLLMDADILIAPNAPDIFAAYPDTSKTYVLFDSLYTQELDYDGCQDLERLATVFGPFPDWPYHGKLKQYFNSGVILFSKNEKLQQYFSLEDVKKSFNTLTYIEQTYLNYLFFKYQIPLGALDLKYNWIPWLSNKQDRHQGYFIHHPTRGYGISTCLRIQTFVNDYYYYYHPLKYRIGFVFRSLYSLCLMVKHNLHKMLKA